jgi:hypothetical protein
MITIKNISDSTQTARWGEPVGSFQEVEAGGTIELPDFFAFRIVNQNPTIWEVVGVPKATSTSKKSSK